MRVRVCDANEALKKSKFWKHEKNLGAGLRSSKTVPLKGQKNNSVKRNLTENFDSKCTVLGKL